MTTTTKRHETLIVPEPGFASPTVALKLAEIADVHAKLERAIRELSPGTLAWQPAPGSNTIGMLVAHIAINEAHLAQVGLRGERDGHVADVLGIGPDDDGLPIEQSGGRPPQALAGKAAVFFVDLLARALTHTRDSARSLREDTLGAEVVRPPRPDGSVRVFDRRWILHHMVEHAALHLGQVNTLRRQWKAANPGA
jgi:uncharacterized damage-inducible protein DinB